MKQQAIIIGLSILFNISLFGQDFISSNNQWNVRLEGFGFTTEIFYIEGDSTVNSTLYSKIWVSYDSLSSSTFQGLVREESNVVYFIPPDLNEGILYDFNAEIGDTVFVKNIFCGDEEIPVNVIDIDMVEYFGISRTRWHLGEDGYVEEYWVEGIGSLNGPLYTNYSYCVVCPVWELLCFHNNDTLEYIMPGSASCYYTSVGISETNTEHDALIKPNPVKKGNPIFVETNSISTSIQVLNSAGAIIKNMSSINDNIIRIETNTFESGLYFITINTGGKLETQKILIR